MSETQKGSWLDWLRGGRPKTGTGRSVPGRGALERNGGRKITVENTVVKGKPVPGTTEKLPDRRRGDRRK